MLHLPSRWLLPAFSVLALCGALRGQALSADTKPAALPLAARARLESGSNPFLCLAFSPDGKWLASGGYEKTISIWDPVSGKEVRRWNGPEGNLASLAFSPDGRLLASGCVYDPVVHLWEAATGREARALEGLPRGTSSLAFSPDGKLLAAGGYHTPDVYLWDVATGKLISQLAGPPVPCPEVNSQPLTSPDYTYAAFAPDGKTLASGHRHGLIRLWDVAARRELRHFRGPISDVFVHLAFISDSRVLTSWGSTIRLRQTDSGKQFREFGEQPELRIACAALSPDGRMLASGSSSRDAGDDTVHVWEVATGFERCRLEGHRYAVSAVAFSPDGKTLVSGSLDGTALVWDLKQFPRGEPPPAELSAAELEARWQELGGSDVPRAYRAVRALVGCRGQSVPYLKDRLRPVIKADPQRLSELIAALDSGRFKQRREATEDLAVQVELAEPALRQALAGQPSVETRQRLEQVLRGKDLLLFTARQLQTVRALEVLENIGSPEAKKVLEALASGSPGLRTTRDAKGALDRLARWPGVRP
jgi:dipeptidyl aminopeptidase/acylaminoacyl peptidase